MSKQVNSDVGELVLQLLKQTRKGVNQQQPVGGVDGAFSFGGWYPDQSA
jgi:hypothetical protein